MGQPTALISGAGIAGCAVANWLAAAGWRPTLVERAPQPRVGGYVIDFWGLGYDLSTRMGLGAAVEAAGYHVKEMSVADDQGRTLARMDVKLLDALTEGRYVSLPRGDLARLLLEAARPNAEMIFGDEIETVSPTEDAIEVRLAGGGGGRFDLVIGADGLHSNLRRRMFGPDQRYEKPLGYAVAVFEAEGYRPRDPDVYRIHSKPGRMVGRFTLRGDRTVFMFVFAHRAALPTDLAKQKALLTETYRDDRWELPEILGRLAEAETLYLDAVNQVVAPQWSKGRAVLLGDAAACVSLLAGQGSALAMIAAYVLAGEIASARGDLPAALQRYERRLRPLFEAKQTGAVKFAGALAPRTPAGLWFRNQVIKLLAAPGVARLVLGREILDPLTLPEYPELGPPRGGAWHAGSTTT